MNKCKVRFHGNVKEVTKFMVDNMEFVEVTDNGLKFIASMNFGKTMVESDELFMKDVYGVKPYAECCNMKIIIYNNEFKHYYDDEYDYEEAPKKIYEFRVENHGSFFDIYKTFEKSVCYQDKFVSKPKEFMSEFFDYFAQPNISSIQDRKELQKKMNQEASLEIEFEVYSFPLDLLNKWYEYYELSVVANWADENEFLRYTRYIEDKKDNLPEDRYINKVLAETELERYTQSLLVNKWVNLHEMITHICEMLYDMKDSFPVNIELEYKDSDPDKIAHMNNKFKYNSVYSKISNTVYSLANAEVFTLARMYASLVDMYKKFMNKNN